MAKNKYIETPEELWSLFIDYKKEVKGNPILKNDFKGKDATPVSYELERPLTMVGFECYVMEHSRITYPDLTHYFENKDNRYSEYVPISTRIWKEIASDQLNGGMTNIYNASLTARVGGYVDKKETEVKETLNIPNIPDIGNRK